jgi:predicted amidohydrolase YtcJ
MYGADSVNNMSPVKSAIEAGLQPSIEVGDGLESIQNFIMRQTEDGRVWNAEERITREQALRMYTNWAARYSGEQDALGSIEPGKLGDLVVLSADYMTFPQENIKTMRVLMTVVGGKVVHEVSGAF